MIEEVQFNYSLGTLPPMDFALIAFDDANGFQSNIPSAHADSPDPTAIQTASLAGLPIKVDNALWNYVIRWAPSSADPDRMLWGARVGYRHKGDG